MMHQSGTFLIIQTNCNSNRSHQETAAAHFVQIQWCDYYNILGSNGSDTYPKPEKVGF